MAIRVSLSKSLVIIQFLLLSTVLNLVTIEGKNILFMGFSVLGALGLIVLNGRFPLRVTPILYIILFLLTLSYVMNYRSADHLSFWYSVFFISSYLVFSSYFKHLISLNTFRKVAFYLLVLYFTVLLAGQLYVLFGLFKGTYISQGLMHGPFGTLFEAGRGFRFYSLSSEPSYAAFIVLGLLYAILQTDPDKKPFAKRNFYAWVITLYMLFSFQSGYGVIIFALLIFFQTTYRNMAIIVIAGIIVAVGAVVVKQPAATRVINLISKFRPGEIQEIARIDASASFRILPTYYYIKDIDLKDPHFYFGHGAGQSSEFLIPLLFKVKVESYEGGFLPQFIYDYGCIFGLFFLLFVRTEAITRLISFETCVILMMLTNANFNTQLFWFVIMISALTKFYKYEYLYRPQTDLRKAEPAIS